MHICGSEDMLLMGKRQVEQNEVAGEGEQSKVRRRSGKKVGEEIKRKTTHGKNRRLR
jgi:hypothetical protein